MLWALLWPAGVCTAQQGDAELLVSWMSGSFSSESQSARDAEFRDIRLHMVPIWSGRIDGHWLYVEQAVAETLDRPYRQRVYRVRLVEPGLLESAVYTLPEPERFVGAWREPSRLDTLRPADLEARAGCEVLLRRRGDTFIGSTLGRLCPSELRGAGHATSDVTISVHRMESWDRGFDDRGRQVWGAETGGYVFERVEESTGQ
jgi:hypothetical protein